MGTDFDVAIVGCGPVGATLAIALGQQGVRVVAVERETDIWHLPRAVSFDGEILRMFQALGVADGIAAVSAPMLGFKYVNEEGQALLDWPLPADRTGSQGWGATYLFHQPDAEQLLRDEINQLPNVELLDGHEVEALDQDEGQVTLTIRERATGVVRRLTAAFAAGCDGGNSFVRRTIGTTFETLGPTQDWVVIDAVKLRDLDLPKTIVGYCWPSRPHLYVPMRDPRVRWELMVLPGDDRSAVGTPEGAYDLIERFVSRADVRIERAAIYKFRSSLADRWRAGRVFLAGDSAHLQPPLRAQGLCSGIRDAINLSWKLSAVISRDADPSLLNTYETERKAHARRWVEIATELSNIINTTDPAVAAGRNAHMLAHPVAYTDETPQLGPGLHGDAAEPAGLLSQQGVADDGSRLDDEVGWRFLVAMTPEIEAELSDRAREALADERWFDVLDAHSTANGDVLARHGATPAIVVRPDRYVLGTAQDAEQLETLIGRWTKYLRPVVAQ